MKTLAAVLFETNKPLELIDLEIPVLAKHQVLIKMCHAGICGSQLNEILGLKGPDSYLPHCLGHEGVGEVLELGPEVTGLSPGDRVIVSWIKNGKADGFGSVYKYNHINVNAGSVTTFMDYTIISENRLTVLPKESDLQLSTLIGCAAATGLGSVINVLEAKKGQSLAVMGVGGIGSLAVIAAVQCGCEPIITIDINDYKLTKSKTFGAFHTINASREDTESAIKKLCPKGLDLAVDASGNCQAIESLIPLLRPQVGKFVILGNCPHGSVLKIDPIEFNKGKKFLGSWGGDTNPERDFLNYYHMLKQHHNFCLTEYMTNGYSLEDINTAINDLKSGKVIRPMIDFKD